MAGAGTIAYFPPGKTPRQEQITAARGIDAEFEAGRPTAVLQAPTGVGKSLIASCYFRQAAALGQTVHLITAQKQLQKQYAEIFKPPEVEMMMGRSNYPCSFEPDRGTDASKGYCRRIEHAALIPDCLKFGTVEEALRFELPPSAHNCPYFEQLTKCLKAPVALHNFHSFLFQQRLGRFGERDLMIIDEAHNVEGVLLQFVQVVISDYLLRLVKVRIDLSLRTPDQVLAWLDRERVEEKLKSVLGDAAETEDAANGLSPEDTDKLRSLLGKIKDLRRFFEMTQWVVDVTEEPTEEDRERTRKLRIRPVFVYPFAKELVFSKASRTLAMSATMLNAGIWSKNLGLARDSVGYVEVPCPFPVANRPIILDYAGDMSWKSQPETLPKLYASIERILARHAGQRGIIHGHSERLCKLILENVPSPRFVHLGQFKARDKAALLKAHAEKSDSVIVGSGFHEGIDLVDDMARFGVIAKVPWPMMEDAFVKARIRADKWYMSYQTSLKLIQSCGRGVRHEKDRCSTYMLDAGFEGFMRQASWLLPKWFTAAITRPARSPLVAPAAAPHNP